MGASLLSSLRARGYPVESTGISTESAAAAPGTARHRPSAAVRRAAGAWGAQPEAIDLDIVHADADVIVVNKPPGLVVHPGAGNPAGTLQNALLHFDPKLAEIPRGGIVHRLDKDTSGLMVVARSMRAHTSLVEQLSERDVHRQYLAIVYGAMVAGGRVDAPLGRHPRDRLKQAVREDGRDAITHYRVRERFRTMTLVECRLETGRTHQIRVHAQHIGHSQCCTGQHIGAPQDVHPHAPVGRRNTGIWHGEKSI